jgi:hypothetical protein
MIRKKHAAILVSLGTTLALLALSSISAWANELTGASVTATCSNYTVSVTGVNGSAGMSVSFTFTLTPTPGSAITISGTIPSTAITINPSTFAFTGSITNPYPGGPLTGSFSFTISGTATLFTTGGQANTVDISSSGTLNCSVANKCPLTQGFWKNHPDAWPVGSLTLGTVTYTEAQLITILKTPVGDGAGADASLNLAHQLIAAMLNVANGSNPGPISATISEANGDLGSGTIPEHIAPSSTLGADMVDDANTLDSYNSGTLTPSCTGPS